MNVNIGLLELLQLAGVIAVAFAGFQVKLIKSELKLLRCSLVSKEDCEAIHSVLDKRVDKLDTQVAVLKSKLSNTEA